MTFDSLFMNAHDLLDLHLITISGTPITAATLAIFVAVIVATFVISKILQRAAAKALALRMGQDTGSIEVSKRLLHYLVLVIGMSVGLATIGIDLTALFAAGAIFAVGLGFAMQNIAQNFVSGLIMLVERSIKPGDILKIQDQLVRVQSQGIRSTIARTLNDEELIVPNSELMQSVVMNCTLKDHLFRVRTRVGVAYESDLSLVKPTLAQAAASVEGRVQEKNPAVHLIEFADHAVVYDVSIWTLGPWESVAGRSELNEAIWWALKEANVTIAYHQLDLHLDPELTDAIAHKALAS